MVKYDIHKNQYRNNTASPLVIDFLMSSQLNFQQKVLKAVSEFEREFEVWERSFVVNKDLDDHCTPTPDDIRKDERIRIIFDKIQIGNKLLRKWGICFSST